MLRNVGILIAIIFAASPASAEIYKCRSMDGRVTYQDAPCGPEAAAEDVVPIVDDRTYDAPLSPAMQQAAEVLRQKDRELAARLENEREQLRQLEAQRRAYEQQRARYQPPVTFVEPYPVVTGVWAPRFPVFPHRFGHVPRFPGAGGHAPHSPATMGCPGSGGKWPCGADDAQWSSPNLHVGSRAGNSGKGANSRVESRGSTAD